MIPCWTELTQKALLQLHQEHETSLEEALNMFLTQCLHCKLPSTFWPECLHRELGREQLLDLLSQCACSRGGAHCSPSPALVGQAQNSASPAALGLTLSLVLCGTWAQ